MKQDSTAIGGASEYVTHAWSGKCKTVSEL
jgi:hypothetical protein